ncbi:hypothetical protein ACQP1U_09595 [Actinomycetota bacterium]
MKAPRASVGLVAVAAVLGLGGCGAGKTLDAGDATVLVGQRSGTGMDALLAGRLEVVGGCVGIGDAVVIWPHGTDVVDENPLSIEVPGAGTVAIGEDIEIGGGFVLEHRGAPRQQGPQEIAGVAVPAACAEHNVFRAAPR